MTDEQIIIAYLAREKAENAKPRGADHPALVAEIAHLARRNLADVRRIVMESVFTNPN